MFKMILFCVQNIFINTLKRDLDERQLQRICSEVADWILKASNGDHHELSEDRDIPDFVVHKELRDRFENIWTKQDGGSIVVEKVTKEKRAQLESSDPFEIQKLKNINF